ncbi:hypothetical protein DRN80_03420 [Methanosarcinales archaeon]|nr:MAG: hypothetical protein DRN80_03420 [Methanosarcinales archaeon]
MKWLNRITGRAVAEIPSIVAFHEMDTWLEKVSELLFRGLGTNTMALYEEIADKREELKQYISELRNAEPKADMPAQITKIGLLSRDKMVKLLYSLCDKIVIPSQTDYKTVLDFHNMAYHSIESVLAKIFKNIYYVRSLFPDEVREVEANLNQLRDILDRLIAPMKGKETKVIDLSRVHALIQRIREQMAEIESEKEKIRAEEEERAAIKHEIELSERKLQVIEEEAEWKRLKEYEAELTAIGEELNTLRQDINNLFTPLQKPLSLLKKQDRTGRINLSPTVRTVITSILSSPVQALNEDIEDYLRSIRAVILEMDALKERTRDRALKWIDHLLNTDTDLSGIRARYELLSSMAEEVRSKLSALEITKEKEGLEHAITAARGQLTRLDDLIAKRRRGIESQEKELVANEILLQKELEEITGKRIEVKFE